MTRNIWEEEFARRNPDLYMEISESAYLRGVEDVLGEQKFAEYLLDRFLAEQCLDSTDGTVSASYLYGRFLEWFNRRSNIKNVPTITWFGRQMSMRYDKRKTGGIIYYKGRRVKGAS